MGHCSLARSWVGLGAPHGCAWPAQESCQRIQDEVIALRQSVPSADGIVRAVQGEVAALIQSKAPLQEVCAKESYLRREGRGSGRGERGGGGTSLGSCNLRRSSFRLEMATQPCASPLLPPPLEENVRLSSPSPRPLPCVPACVAQMHALAEEVRLKPTRANVEELLQRKVDTATFDATVVWSKRWALKSAHEN